MKNDTYVPPGFKPKFCLVFCGGKTNSDLRNKEQRKTIKYTACSDGVTLLTYSAVHVTSQPRMILALNGEVPPPFFLCLHDICCANFHHGPIEIYTWAKLMCRWWKVGLGIMASIVVITNFFWWYHWPKTQLYPVLKFISNSLNDGIPLEFSLTKRAFPLSRIYSPCFQNFPPSGAFGFGWRSPHLFMPKR